MSPHSTALIPPSPSYSCASPCLYPPAPVAAAQPPPADWTQAQAAQWLQRVLRLPPDGVRRVFDLLGQPCGSALLTLRRKEIAQRVGDDAVGALISDELLKAVAAQDDRHEPHPPGPGLFGDVLDLDAYTEWESTQRVEHWFASNDSEKQAPALAPALAPLAASPLRTLAPANGASSEPAYQGLLTEEDQQLVYHCEFAFANMTSPSSDSGNQEVPEWCGSPAPFSPAASPLLRADRSPAGAPSPCAAPAPQPARRKGGRPPRPPGAPAPPARVRRRSGSADTAAAGKGRLWPFILELLMDPTKSSIIQWVDEEEGVFAFLNGRRAAELWGERKLRGKEMTYEKMTRTLRTYKNGAFAPHSRRLFYKFGPKANWREVRRQAILRHKG